jgi:RND superfamily putative drug exporter
MSLPLSTAGLARVSSRHPWRTIGLWVALLILAAVAASGLNDVLTQDETIYGSDAATGQQLVKERLRGDMRLSENVIVHADNATVDDPAFQQVVRSTTAALAAMPEVVASAVDYFQAREQSPEMAAEMVSADRHTALIAVTFAKTGHDGVMDADAYLTTLDRQQTPGYQVLSIGDATIQNAFMHTSEKDLQKSEMIGLPVAILVLVIVFGALIAAGVPIVLALAAVFVAIGLTAVVGQFMELSFFVVNMITMIGLAVGIDYSLFIVDRYREERRNGHTKHEAIAIAGGTASKAVLFSGITVVLALTGLLMLPTSVFRSLGIGAVLVVIVAVAGSLTLVPAMLALLGDRIDWPRRRRGAQTQATRQTGPGVWGRVTHAVMAHPVIAVALTLTILIGASLPVMDLKRGEAGAETLPGNIRAAYAIMARDFSAGQLAPVEIVIDGPRTPANEAAITRLQVALATDSGFVPGTSVEWNPAGDLADVTAALNGPANADASYATIERLRGQLVPLAFAGADARVYVSGETAYNRDFNAIIDAWTPRVFAFVLGLSFILLTLAFRSLVVPIKAIVMNLLSVGAAYGLLVAVFQKGYLHSLFGFQHTPAIEAWIPIFLFCVLFGLSMDYHVFLLSRIREHFDATGNNRESVAIGLQSTGRLITGAAAIMMVVFSGFAAGNLVMIQQMGFGLAVAVFLDATIVRSVVVPASMALLGDRNWYLPRWLGWLPDLRVEGAATHAPAVVAVATGAGD